MVFEFTAGRITGGHGVRAVGKINPVFLQRKVGAAGAMEHMGAAVSDVTAALVFRGVGLNGRVFGRSKTHGFPIAGAHNCTLQICAVQRYVCIAQAG